MKKQASRKVQKPAKNTKYKIDLRSVDDKIIEAIMEMDSILNEALFILVSNMPKYVADHLLNQTYVKDIKPGGVRIFSGSRKKENIKLKLIELVSYIDSPKDFIEKAVELGLIRGTKEKIIYDFMEGFKNNWFLLLKHYGDPFFVYQKIYPYYSAYGQLKEHITQITFTTLSKIVLSKYNGWLLRRVINSTVDYVNYEEDVQNSSFSIRKAISLFSSSKNKSFFSYVTRWIKEGISSSDFAIAKEIKVEDELGNRVDAIFRPLDDSVLEHLEGKNYMEYMDSLNEADTPVEVSALEYFKGSFPIPNELRILFRLLELKKC